MDKPEQNNHRADKTETQRNQVSFTSRVSISFISIRTNQRLVSCWVVTSLGLSQSYIWWHVTLISIIFANLLSGHLLFFGHISFEKLVAVQMGLYCILNRKTASQFLRNVWVISLPLGSILVVWRLFEVLPYYELKGELTRTRTSTVLIGVDLPSGLSDLTSVLSVISIDDCCRMSQPDVLWLVVLNSFRFSATRS